MSDEFLGDRKKALEESFFAKENQRLLERMREEKRKLAAKDALAGASRIQDDALLDRLVELEIGPDTWTALSLIPLVEVAWADGVLEARERRAILEAAANTGVTRARRATTCWRRGSASARTRACSRRGGSTWSASPPASTRPAGARSTTRSWAARSASPKPPAGSSDSGTRSRRRSRRCSTGSIARSTDRKRPQAARSEPKANEAQ